MFLCFINIFCFLICFRRGARTSEEDCSSNQAAKYNISVLNAFALDIFEEAILTERPKHVYVISKPNDFSHYLSAIVERFQRSQMDKPKVIEAWELEIWVYISSWKSEDQLSKPSICFYT